MAPSKAFLLGISGPSSSGKTTLARLLRDIIPNSYILHEDDFYKTDADIPIDPKSGLQDWDCLESLNLPALEAALKHIKATGALPEDLESQEDKNDVGQVEVDEGVVAELKEKVRAGVRVAIIDGFLLYSNEMSSIRELFDAKLFLRTDYETAKTRREARSGYVTLEGFWADPPGYVDKIVWPNYVKDHAFLFQDGDVEGEVDRDVANRLGIQVMPKTAKGYMTECLKWAYRAIEASLSELKGS